MGIRVALTNEPTLLLHTCPPFLLVTTFSELCYLCLGFFFPVVLLNPHHLAPQSSRYGLVKHILNVGGISTP